jgi:hypothetical protein
MVDIEFYGRKMNETPESDVLPGFARTDGRTDLNKDPNLFYNFFRARE